jgi:hypothetical protein
VRAALTLTAFALLPALVPAAVGASTGRPPMAVSVSPARLALAAPGSRRIKVRNDGAERVMVGVTRRTVGRRTTAKPWLRIVPARLSLRSGESAILTVRFQPRPHAEPGDHHAVVLLTTRPVRGGRVNVQVRLGVRVTMRVPGRIVRRLALRALHVQRRRNARILFVPVVNRGNVTIALRGHVTAALVRRGLRLARLSARARREVSPGARALLALPYRGRVRGRVAAVVQVRLAPGIRPAERRYRLRL